MYISPNYSYFTVTLTRMFLEEHPLCSRIQDLTHTISGLKFIILTLWDRLKSTLKLNSMSITVLINIMLAATIDKILQISVTNHNSFLIKRGVQSFP